MTIPAEISAIVRAATSTVKAFRALQRAKSDEAPESVLARYRKTLHETLIAQDRALEKAAELAKRPNAPIDFVGMLNGISRVVGALKSGDVERALRDKVRGVIDVEPIK